MIPKGVLCLNRTLLNKCKIHINKIMPNKQNKVIFVVQVPPTIGYHSSLNLLVQQFTHLWFSIVIVPTRYFIYCM